MAFLELLTPVERLAIEKLGQVADLLAGIVEDGPTRPHDLSELYHHIHAVQRAIGSQAAARAYPQLFRLLGSVVP